MVLRSANPRVSMAALGGRFPTKLLLSRCTHRRVGGLCALLLLVLHWALRGEGGSGHNHVSRLGNTKDELQVDYQAPALPRHNPEGSLYDYVLDEYQPLVPPSADSLTSFDLFSLLLRRFAEPVFAERALRLAQELRSGLGVNQVVWGVKIGRPGSTELFWELYVYDYDDAGKTKLHPGKRLDRFRSAVGGTYRRFGCDLRTAERTPYFMCVSRRTLVVSL